MRDLVFEERGRKRVIERNLAVNCVICGASLACPPEADFWSWLKCGDVLMFRQEHAAHGGAKGVGAQITHTETEHVVEA